MDVHTTMQKKLSDLNTIQRGDGRAVSLFRGTLVYIRHISMHWIGRG